MLSELLMSWPLSSINTPKDNEMALFNYIKLIMYRLKQSLSEDNIKSIRQLANLAVKVCACLNSIGSIKFKRLAVHYQLVLSLNYSFVLKSDKV